MQLHCKLSNNLMFDLLCHLNVGHGHTDSVLQYDLCYLHFVH
mgnify:CR=1 FL=1